MVQDKHSIPETTKVRLIEIGVSSAKHSRAGLAELFPGEFKIHALDLNADDLARVLIHFVEQQIITLPNRRTAVRARKVGPGWHACHFYQNLDQLLDVVVPYVIEGLENGDACLWVAPAAITPTAAGQEVARRLEGVEGYLASGQLEILAHPDWYLDAQGRFKTFEEIGAALMARQDVAMAKGFPLLRAAGDAGWISCTEQSRHFIDYENKVNAALQATQVAAICTYRLDVTADELIAIVNAHQDAVVQTATP